MHPLRQEEYDHLLDLNSEWGFGIREGQVDRSEFGEIYERRVKGRGLLMLREIEQFHRPVSYTHLRAHETLR